MKQQRYAPHGTLALMPEAFGVIFDLPEIKETELTANGVAVVEIRGPLMHRKEFFFDSYEAIKERVAEALALEPRFVLLSIDSPGGVVSGAFDTARELRKMATAAGVDLYAHVGGHATSAAYALASAATWIGASETAMLGSIGVIDTMVDATGANKMMGLQVELVTSGERKTDGNPNIAISDDARASRQLRVDDLAEMFFALVVEHGWGVSVGAVEAMEANIIHGVDAVRVGLATEIATLDQSIAFATPEALRTGTGATATEEEERYNMKANPKDDAVASLRKMAEGDDEDEAKKAKAALKSLGVQDDDDDAQGDDDDDAQGDDDDDDEAKAKAEAEAKAKADAKAEGDDDDEPDTEGDDDDAEAKGANVIALRALAEVHDLKADIKAGKRQVERDELIASRPDFEPALVKILATAPMAVVRSTVKDLKRGPSRKQAAAAAATATATVRGEGQGDGTAARLPPAEKAELDRRMGLTAMAPQTVHTPTRMSFGVATVVPAVPPIAPKGK